jgi:GcrA cell cycle regulator
MTEKIWVEFALKVLKEEVIAGGSATDVAARMSVRLRKPISKNMVIGACHRHLGGLTLNPDRHIKSKVLISQMVTVAPQPEQHGYCKWPLGDPGHKEFTFCGEQTFNGKTYCDSHDIIAHVPSKPRSDVMRPHYRKWKP